MAQAAPAAPAMEPTLPMAPMPTMPTSAPGGGSDPEREEIGSPLDSLAKVLYDIDIETFIKNNIGENAETIAKMVWQKYGGDDKGLSALPGYVGKRVDKKAVPPEVEKQEEAATENKRWERLPMGKNIAQVINSDQPEEALKNLTDSITGIVVNMATAKPEQEGAGGGAEAGGLFGPPA